MLHICTMYMHLWMYVQHTLPVITSSPCFYKTGALGSTRLVISIKPLW